MFYWWNIHKINYVCIILIFVNVGQGSNNPQNMQQKDENNPRNQYSIPGILHFIQHEWARFEMERSQWEVEKAELQARIAFLQVLLINLLIKKLSFNDYNSTFYKS